MLSLQEMLVLMGIATADPSLTTKKPKVFTTLKSTALYFICVITDEIEVGIIIAKDVPTAKCIIKDWSMPIELKIQKSTGTVINPPPIPNSPAMKPTGTADNAITIIIKII